MALEAELDTYSYAERREPGLTSRVVRELFEQSWESVPVLKRYGVVAPNMKSQNLPLQNRKVVVFSSASLK